MDQLTDIALATTGLLVMLAVPAYLVLQIWAALRLSGAWRRAALLPVVLAVPIALWCAYAFADQSNLWPVTFILFAPIGTFYLAIILAASRGTRAG